MDSLVQEVLWFTYSFIFVILIIAIDSNFLRNPSAYIRGAVEFSRGVFITSISGCISILERGFKFLPLNKVIINLYLNQKVCSQVIMNFYLNEQ